MELFSVVIYSLLVLVVRGLPYDQRRFRPIIPRKILGGLTVPENDMLYMLSMEVKGYFNCGASAIGTHWAITAAHCLDKGEKAEDVILKSGSKKKCEGMEHKVAEIILHPRYEDVVKNDIAMLKMKDPFTPGKSLAFIDIVNSKYELKENTKLIVAGWGMTETGFYSRILLQTPVTYITNKQCERTLTYGYGFKLIDGMICAYTEGQDSTKGDSGGPLIFRKGGKDVLVGIVSYGYGKGKEDGPGIYTNVGSYVKWIIKITGNSVNNQESIGNRNNHNNNGDFYFNNQNDGNYENWRQIISHIPDNGNRTSVFSYNSNNDSADSNFWLDDDSNNFFIGSGSFIDGSGSFIDGSGSFIDGSGSFIDGSGSFIDGSSSFIDGSGSVINENDCSSSTFYNDEY